MSDRFDQYYMLQNQAKKMEQAGNYSKAIELFTEIVTQYQPYDDYAYDRLSVLLEKNNKIKEAYTYCEQAIDKIKSGALKGDINKYLERIHRLEHKLKDSKITRKEKGEKEVLTLRFPFFKNIKGKRILLPVILYGLALLFSVPFHWLRFVIFVSFYGFMDYLIDVLIKLSKNKRAWLTAGICLIFLSTTISLSFQLPEVKAWIQLKEDQKNAVSETMVKESAGDIVENPDQALIDGPLLDKANKTIALEPIYDSCELAVSEQVISVELIVIGGTSKEEIQRVLKKLSKNISALASSKGTTAPIGEFYGSLYDQYRINFKVLDTFDIEQLSGSLFKNKFTWQ